MHYVKHTVCVMTKEWCVCAVFQIGKKIVAVRHPSFLSSKTDLENIFRSTGGKSKAQLALTRHEVRHIQRHSKNLGQRRCIHRSRPFSRLGRLIVDGL